MDATDRKNAEKAVKLNAGLLGIRVSDGYFKLVGQPAVPVAGAVVTVDRGEAAKRITATRVALTGIFALALKKDNTKLFVTIEGADGSVMVREVAAKKEEKARILAASLASLNA
ncbi:hypothetical protein [Streptomyces sp. NPDC059874]|uniref:hypothetical protein n=1 Tax=Streptomyces sp. NPDC059874 TaxID=3346983 RepID=UPI0036572268